MMKERWPHNGMAMLLFGAVVVLSASGQPPTPTRLSQPEIHRTPLTPAEVPAALARVADGTLVRMSPVEFDRLLLNSKNVGPRPQLIEARYRARFAAEHGENNLIGTAEWSVRQPASGAGRLELPGLQLPLRQAKWSDGQEAVLYKGSADTNPMLFVPTGGDRALNLEWSARPRGTRRSPFRSTRARHTARDDGTHLAARCSTGVATVRCLAHRTVPGWRRIAIMAGTIWRTPAARSDPPPRSGCAKPPVRANQRRTAAERNRGHGADRIAGRVSQIGICRIDRRPRSATCDLQREREQPRLMENRSS